jgi:hypothetical protein
VAAGQGALDLGPILNPEHRLMVQRAMGDAQPVEQGEQVGAGLGHFALRYRRLMAAV